MHALVVRSMRATGRAPRALALIAAAAATLPLGVHASTITETFQWVPTSENPTTAQTNTASGTLTLTLSSFSLTGPTTPPNFGPYFASGANATTADITALSYTAADGQTLSLSNVTTESVRSTTTPWQTSGLDIPAGAPAPAAYYLISGFNLSGTTVQGAPFQIANNIGTAGATYASGVGNGDNTFNTIGAHAAITDGGYWKLETTTTVPLPAGLPLLLSGLGLMARFVRRRGSLQAD